jgi:hypothetical protein
MVYHAQGISQLPLARAARALRAAGKNSGDLALETLRTERRSADDRDREGQQVLITIVADNAVVRDWYNGELLRIGERLKVFVRSDDHIKTAVKVGLIPPFDDFGATFDQNDKLFHLNILLSS